MTRPAGPFTSGEGGQERPHCERELTLELHVFLAVLAAAAMHAAWNAALKLNLEPFLAMTLIAGASGVMALPALAAFGFPVLPAWPWLAGSILLHLGYYVVLSAAYARADMSQVYPIARGGAPLLTASASTLLLGEPVGDLQMLGIAGLGCSVAAMSVVGRRRGTAFDPKAVGLAILTALVICGYTLVDGRGARAAGDPHAYTAALFVLDGVPPVLFALWWRGRTGLVRMRRFWVRGAAAGSLSLGSYWIAIWAMTVAPIALVAALRESSVLFATAIAVVFLKEPLQWPRAILALAILASLILIRAG
jgi:drug/metabolite transporter (DMT)-like permease